MATVCSIPAEPRMTADERFASEAVVAWQQWIEHVEPVSKVTSLGRVLLVSYQFPPVGGSGVQRPAKLAKYLPACGWAVEVLTADHDRFPWADDSLVQDVPDEVRTHHVAGREPACVARRLASIFGADRRVEDGLFWRLTRWTDRLGLGNGESLWAGPAAKAAVVRHRERPFDAVISTGPPHFVHRVALGFAESAGVPWLADLRDPLVSDFDRQAPSLKNVARMRRLEQDILRKASRIVTTCPSFAADLQERYPQRKNDICSIANGFDREDILSAVSPQDIAHTEAGSACEFVAVGAFYGRRELARIVNPLYRVLAQRPYWQGRVRLTVAGTIDAEQKAYWQRNRPAWLTLAGYVNHAEAIRTAALAACSIVVVPACEHGQMSIPGKTFELLALPTHVLALVPPQSDTARVVSRAGASTVVAFENDSEVEAAMSDIIAARLDGSLNNTRDWQTIDTFDRQNTAARFADSLNAIAARRSASNTPCEVEVA